MPGQIVLTLYPLDMSDKAIKHYPTKTTKTEIDGYYHQEWAVARAAMN